ncbi:MAG: ATP-binding protein [Flavobacteriales bacterium]|nr:MAG: ATP-binding protein [Flavobacteriales bacterium]
MKNKANISDSSIESAGLPKDYKQAVSELIWNGYDAKATKIDIRFVTNEVDHITKLVIADNGEGIEFENLSQTFGKFLDSVKRNSFQRSSYNRGKKGKGRFAFSTFAGKATWHTVYKKEDKFLEYNIVISKTKKDEFEDQNKKVSKSKQTGTEVILEQLFEVTAYSFSNQEFKDYLAKEFGWFLFLNKDAGYTLEINGEPIEYDYLIPDNDKKELIIKDEEQKEHKFLITYLRWSHSIGDKYYYYFLNQEKREVAKKLTSYNNNAIDFHHSVFIESDFFNAFELSSDESEGEDLFSGNKNNKLFKALMNDLNEYLFRKQKDFIRGHAAEELVQRLETKGVFPKFANNKYDLERKKDLINVVKELYCVQPKVFKGLGKEQEKTFLGFLNLLLDTDERENILEIVEGIVQLTKEERSELVSVLRKSSFSKILATIKLIENRAKVVALLKTLVFELKKFTTERNHIQKAIEESYWLFGEQYHLASADQNFQQLLGEYLHIIDDVKEPQKLKSYDWKKRPDIFMCRKRNIPDTHDSEYELEENIMVELKRPTVIIGKEQFRQIDDYLDFIMKEEQFNSQTRRWKFYVISNKVDDYIEKQYEAFKDKGKRFLVHQAGKYEIYAMTWDDLFRTFEIKHSYLLEKLEFDKNAIKEELQLKGVKLDVASSNGITKQIIDISEN